MVNFKKALNKKIARSLKNDYGIENYDEYRFNNYPDEKLDVGEKRSNEFELTIQKVKNIVKKIIGYNAKKDVYLSSAHTLIREYENGLQKLWETNTIDKELLVSLITYRVLGYKKVKLPRNNITYWDALKTAKTLEYLNDSYNPKFLHFVLNKFDLNPIGYDIKLYFSEIGIAIDFILEQYAYKVDGKNSIAVDCGDTVLDLGGCWGDTALYFAHKTGNTGKVYSFEFIPNNIKLFNLNTSFNPNLINQIELVKKPVSNKSGEVIYYKDHGPGSKVEFSPFEDYTGEASTLSIDDFVLHNKLTQVDFIKMDIEGAELKALEGAIGTIKHFKPKLAIAIYHSFDDFVNIPNWILDLNIGYEIFIDHFTIHAEETVCFAKLKQ